jgi:hypothetical protein
MGKAAYNERIKLLATWYNNVSVGLTLTGVLIPVFSLLENFQAFDDLTTGRSHPTLLQGLQFVVACGAFVLALTYAASFHNEAIEEIEKIQD